MPAGIYDRSVKAISRTEKTCPDCGVTQSVESFHKNKAAPDERQVYCRSCSSRRNFQRSSVTRKKWYGDQYGMTEEDFDRRLINQGNSCEICGGGPKGNRWGRFCVDHDHNTGKVRGIICGTCNLGLGRFQDDPQLLRAAAGYLERALEEGRA